MGLNLNKLQRNTYWTHPSIRPLLGEGDPVEVIIDRAKYLTFEAMQKCWSGPPFDPFELADILKIKIIACGDVLDARTIPYDKDHLQIEFNPNQSKERIRFSIAHEIAHTLFTDCNQYVRERQSKRDMRSDDWQLEMLCNVAASEILMPTGSFNSLRSQPLDIDALTDLKRTYDVSFEALLHRVVKISDSDCFAFFCSKKDILDQKERYKIDYIIKSNNKIRTAQTGSEVPSGSYVEDCTAIGFTSKGDEDWPGLGKIHIECVGISPYPSYYYPRVAGIAQQIINAPSDINKIKYVKGDATQPRGSDKKIIAFVINDKGLSWGAGFARCLQKKWPFVQRDFKNWVLTNRRSLSLGNIHFTEIDEWTLAFKMICQHGYGPSPTPRIRYKYLEECLRKLSEEAIKRNATVHMPRIGAGEAGGSWEIVEELIENNLCKSGIKVTVYDLPKSKRIKSFEDPLNLFNDLN